MSAVVTVRNEAGRIGGLLASLQGEDLVDVVVVDAASTDGTVEEAMAFEGRVPLTVEVRPCRRGEGRNIGAGLAKGELLAFTDGDCVVRPGWAQALATAWAGDARTVVAGTTVTVGRGRRTRMHRVELPHRGQDTTWPSCNLAYPRALFDRLGGFDASFVTAEDIDLNLRALDEGARIVHAPDAVVEARAREGVAAFLKQAYWNGYGRKQLTRKHGRLWSQYRVGEMARRQLSSPWSAVRLGAGLAGYASAKLGRRPPT